MSINFLLQQYDAIGPMAVQAPITINQSFLGSSELITSLRSGFGVDTFTLNCITSQTVRTDTLLKLTGTTTLPGLSDVLTTFSAYEQNGELVATIEVQAPPGWSLDTLCPSLPGHTTRLVALDDAAWLVEANFLTRLSFGVVRLICSSAAVTDAASGCSLLPGLNLVGELYLEGVLYPFGAMADTLDPLPVSGPIREFVRIYDPQRFTGIRLRAPFKLETDSLGPLALQKAELFMKSGLTSFDTDPLPSATRSNGIYLLAQATLGGRPVEMTGKYDIAGSDSELSLRGTFTDFAVAGFSTLSQHVGVEGFETLPSEVQSPSGFALTEFGISFDCIDYHIKSLMVGIGLPVKWEIIPGTMTLTEIEACFTVNNPFDASRSISTTVSALLAFKKFNLAAWMTIPSFAIGAGLPAGQTLPLGDLLESVLPAETDLPELTITQLQLRAAPRDKSFSMLAKIEDLLSVPVGATSFDISSLAVMFDYVGGTAGAASTSATVSAAMTLGDASALIAGSIKNGLTLSGSLSNFDLKKFWTQVTNGESLPAEVPDIILETISFRVTPKTGAFSLLGSAKIAWDHLGGDSALAANVQFSLDQTVAGSTRLLVASLSLQGNGPLTVAKGFDLNSFNLLFKYATGSGWSLGGGMGVNLFDTLLDVQASYEKTTATQKIKLRAMASPAKNLIKLSGIGKYAFQQLDLLIERQPASSGSGSGGGKAKTFFDLRLASRLEIDTLFAIDGYLGISNTLDGRSALSFKPNPGTANVKIDLPGCHGMGVDFSVFEVGVVKENASAPWSFTGTLTMGFHGFPGFLGQALPSKLNAKLVASSSVVSISAVNVTDPIGIAFPKARGKSLGQAFVQLNEVGLSIKPTMGLIIEAGLGLPAELNAYLGTQLLRVYQPGNMLTMTRVRLALSGSGVTAQFLGSPFAGANAIVVKGEAWFDVDLGQYGALRLKMPTFVYDGVSQYFEAGGGFEITRTLALPLAPLKMFLNACGCKEMADIFPSKIPLDGLVLVDKDGNLKIDEFISFVKKAGDVPGEVVTTLKKTGKVLNRFPDGFKQYFNLQVPDSLEFKFGFSPTGRIAIGLRAPKKPVRVMFPALVQSYVPMPGLWGVEVRKFTLGSLMSGALLYGEIDATIDQFDLPSLIVSLALPSDPAFPLPTSDQLQRRILLKNVFCVVPVASGLPVPVPLFYDEIGFEYQGIEGLGLQAHVGFPKPALDGAGASAVFQAFSDFSKDNKTLLDPKTPPGGVDLTFVFHDEFVQAPEYLGGKLLGTKGKPIKISAWKYLASMLNFSKTFSLNDCIGAIPLEQRVGSAAYRFAFMSFDCDWMLTTPGEFAQGAYQQLKLSKSDVADFVAVLPSVATNAGKGGGGEGLVTFVRGKADLGFLKLDAAFGLAASGSSGFNTGFKFDGVIGKIELELQGAIMVNAPLAGSSSTASANLSPGTTASASVSTNISTSTVSGSLALALNGKNAWIEIPASDSLVLPEYTIELWIKSAKAQTGEWVEMFGIDTLSNGSQRNCYLEINTKGSFYHHRFKDAQGGNSGAPNSPDGSVKWDQWQHVALTNDGVTAKTFINGQQVASGPVAGTLTLFRQPIFIGKEPGSGNNKFWHGEIGEIRIWRCARDADDIDEMFREVLDGDETNLVSLYRFDADSGSLARDLCGRNHGKITNGSFVASDLLLLDGLEFDGKSDYIEIADAEALRIGPYTAEVWFKPYAPQENAAQVMAQRMAKMGIKMTASMGSSQNRGSEWGGLFGKVGRNYTLILNRSGYLHHRFHTAKGYNDGAPNSANNVVQWNEWNHVAISNDGKVAKTFLNGVKLVEGAVDGAGLVIDKGNLIMGHSPDAATESFAGQIAEVRLWQGARSEGAIAADFSRRIAGNTPNLRGLWRMGAAGGDTLPDLCGSNPGRLHMSPKRSAATASGSQSASSLDAGLVALSAKAKSQGKTALQVQGHTQLTVLGHVAMVGDLAIIDSSFWFSGTLDLFPSSWPIRVYGHVEGLISKQQFYLSGETENQLFGLTLSSSRLFISNEAIRLESQWLGQFLLLNISWDKDNPVFAGSIGFKFAASLDFGAVRINGVKVSNNVHLSFEIGADVAVTVSRNGFAAKIHAQFQINGKGFDLTFAIAIAPSDFTQLANAIKRQIIDAPEKYLAHLFVDAATWMKNIGNDAIDFAADSGEAVGAALKVGFNASKETALSLMKAQNYAASQVGAALGKAYGQSAKDCANLLKGAGYAVEDVGHALENAFGQSADSAAKVLKDIGYGATDVSKALSSAYGKTADECKNLLKSCGFSSKDIDGAIKSVGKSVSKGVSKVGKKLHLW
jgi:hypothetical protein